MLQRGDIVDVVAPGSSTSMRQVEAGCEVLRRWGLEPRLPARLFGPKYLYADDDAARARTLLSALRAADSRAVWAVRGGYGCTRLLPALARSRRPALAKLLIGFSDVTALQIAVEKEWGWPSLHAPNLTGLASGTLPARHLWELRRLVFGEQSEIEYGGLRALNEAARDGGEIRGVLRGGNLKLCQSLLGTRWQPDWKGALVVLEDVGERAYSVDRMLVQFRQAGLMRGVRAVVFGDITGGLEADGSSLHAQVLADFAASGRVPVFSGLAFGHDVRFKPLPLGARVEIHRGRRARLHARVLPMRS